MKKIIIISLLSFILLSCNNIKNEEQIKEPIKNEEQIIEQINENEPTDEQIDELIDIIFELNN